MIEQIIPDNTRSIIIARLKNGDTRQYVVGRNCDFTLLLPVFSGIKAQVDIILDQPGSRAEIIGFILAGLQNLVELKTNQIHIAPSSSSRLLIKSILSDDARLNFQGIIRVEKAAQKTDAYQRNDTLLLSDRSQAVSEPQLEIMANDVRCTHGATVGYASPEALWYLTTRGISESNAVKLIATGFWESALSGIADSPELKQLRIAIGKRLLSN